MNSIQGQGVASVDELLEAFSDQEIYQLAQDRTSKSHNLIIGSNVELDANRQLYLSASVTRTDATVSSGGVSATPDSDSLYLAADYSIRGYFAEGDFTTLGFRLSQSESSNTFSILSRVRLNPGKGIRLDPRLNLDYRESIDSDVQQWILRPSIKLSYKPGKKVNLEASIGAEVSDFNLPEMSDDVAYALYLGYRYQF